MQLSPYEPAMSADVARAYNELVRDVPHCWPVSAEEFGAAVNGAHADERLDFSAAFVARSGSSVDGFVHAATARSSDDDGPPTGVVRFFWYRRGRREAGKALLDRAEGVLRERGATCVQAFYWKYKYRFHHLRCANLSEHLDHVQALVAFNGYRAFAGEIFLAWPDFESVEAPAADVDATYEATWTDGCGRRPNLRVSAYQQGREIGACESVCGGEYSSHDEPQDWLFTTALNVDEAAQARGVGRCLLLRSLAEGRLRGYRHAAISTAWDNYRAFVFYSNYGYRVVDWTYAFRRELA